MSIFSSDRCFAALNKRQRRLSAAPADAGVKLTREDGHPPRKFKVTQDRQLDTPSTHLPLCPTQTQTLAGYKEMQIINMCTHTHTGQQQKEQQPGGSADYNLPVPARP